MRITELALADATNDQETGPKRATARMAQARAERACWRMLTQVNATLDLSCADVIEVVAEEPGAHIALLARQFPGVGFVTGGQTEACAETVRVLWAPDGLRGREPALFDAIAVTHPVEEVGAILKACAGFARVAGRREFDGGQALAVMGRGLARDLFRSRVRTHEAA
jgi:hypothetical protein